MSPTKSHSISRLLFQLLRTERKEIAVILTYGLGVGVLSLAVPVGVQALVNTVMFGSVSQPLLFLILAVFLGLSVAAAFRTLQILVVEKLQQRFFARVALELSSVLPRVRVDRIAGAKFPELVNRFFDVLVVQKSTSTLLLEGFALVLQAIIGLVLLAFYHPALLAFDAVLVIAAVGIIFGLGRGAVSTAIEESVQKYRVAAWLEEVAGKSVSFRTADSRRMALQKADELVVGYLRARQRHFRILLRQVVGSLGLQAVASAALLGLGAVLVIRNQLTLGQLVAAEFVVTNVLNSLAKFQKHLEAFYDLAAGLDKIEGLMDLPLEDESCVERPQEKGPARLSLKNVGFSYGAGTFSLRPLSQEIAPGARVALRGLNGSGKSTLIDLLYGLKSPSVGALSIDGVDYRGVAGEELRQHVALVRGVEIIADTLLANVVFGRSDVSVSVAKEALRKVGLLDEVMRLPKGLETPLGENGAPLSISYAQKLMIARAIAGSPRLLLIDESLDAIDGSSLQAALDVLFAPTAPWTLVICTHDAVIEDRCDAVLRLSDNVERGAS